MNRTIAAVGSGKEVPYIAPNDLQYVVLTL